MSAPRDKYENFETSELLSRLSMAYAQCLETSRNYAESCIQDKSEDDELDLDSLQIFLDTRSGLLKSIEALLSSLFARDRDETDCRYKVLVDEIIFVLEEISELEVKLSKVLNSFFAKTKNTIDYMLKAQPVFRHYSQLGGHIHPSRLSGYK